VLGVDGISLFFVLLVTLLTPLCLLMSSGVVQVAEREYIASSVLLEIFLILVFTVRDVLLFYVFFECVLIPMFIIIGS